MGDGGNSNVLLPNTLIWRVNDVEGDPARMAEELERNAGRQVVMQVRLPPSTRFSKLRSDKRRQNQWVQQAGAMSFARPWLAQPPAEDHQDSGAAASSSNALRAAGQASTLRPA